MHKGRPVVLLLAHLVSKAQNPKACMGGALLDSSCTSTGRRLPVSGCRATRVPRYGEDSSQGTQSQYPVSISRMGGQETSMSLASEDRTKLATPASFPRPAPLTLNGTVSAFCVLRWLHRWEGQGYILATRPTGSIGRCVQPC